MDRSALRSAGAELLGRVQWQLFATLTFDPAKLRRRHGRYQYEKEWKALRLLFNSINLKSFGRQQVRRNGAGLLWFAALEPHKDSGHHFHVLIAGMPDDQLDWCAAMVRAWWKQHMGDPDVRPAANLRASAAYCWKSIDSENEWAMSNSFVRFAALPKAA